MPQTEDKCSDGTRDRRRKRLIFRSHHTGMKENDILLGQFVDRYINVFSDAEVDWLERLLLDNNDIDLYNWTMGKERVPDSLNHPLMHKLINFKNVV